MSPLTETILCAVAAFVAGATPFGYLAGRLKGVDVRQHGSGNIGATNVIRVLGKGIGIPVFLLDFLKGLLPVLAVRHFLPDNENAAIAAGICAVLGHNYTFWLHFKGGKGIATSAGILFGLVLVPAICGVLTWGIAFFATRYVAVASICASVAIPTAAAIVYGPGPLLYFCIFLGALAIWRHRTNIRRLIDGTEHRFTRRGREEQTAP